MRSPIFALERAIAGCAFKIAPEREQELAKLRDRHQIVLQPVDERGFGIRVNPASGVVTLPVASLEYLWACTYQYLIVYQEMVDAQRAGLPRLDLAGSPRLRTAEALYSWARNNLDGDGKRPWPDDLPSPTVPQDRDGYVPFANEIFVAALAWMIHHEIAHVTLGHPALTTSRGMTEENEADTTATRWILSDLERDDPKLLKRALGIATAILTLQSLQVGPVAYEPSTHPPAHVRLDNCLGNYEVGSEQQVQAFSVAVLQVLLSEEGIAANIDGESFQEILSDLLVDKSRLD
jgi:hypothetical protein